MRHSLRATAMLVFAGVWFSTTVLAQAKPNVVLMLADNLGFGDLSVYNGGTRGGIRTPNVDKLASEGMRFTQFLVEPGCTPSRAGLLTGQYSIRSGMSLGQTDEFGFHVIDSPVHIHDLQASLLHCLGFNHERLTFHHAGRDFRLTDVHGQVVQQVLA